MAGQCGNSGAGFRLVRADRSSVCAAAEPSALDSDGGRRRLGRTGIFRGKALGHVGWLGRPASLGAGSCIKEAGASAILACMLAGFMGSNTWSRIDLIAKVVLNVIAVVLLLLLGKSILTRKAT